MTESSPSHTIDDFKYLKGTMVWNVKFILMEGNEISATIEVDGEGNFVGKIPIKTEVYAGTAATLKECIQLTRDKADKIVKAWIEADV